MIKKYQVVENYSSTEGTLYKGEVLKEDNNNTLEGHKRLEILWVECGLFHINIL